MSNPFDSSHTGEVSSDSHANSTPAVPLIQARLQAGFSALKQKDYAGAIAHFKHVQQSATEATVRFKAQMGLVKAYVYAGNIESAVRLCQTLQTQTHPQVRGWATETLDQLSRRFPAAVAAKPVDEPGETGFVPLNPASAAASQGELTEPDLPDATGFVPLVASPTRGTPTREPIARESTPPSAPIDRPNQHPAPEDPEDPEYEILEDPEETLLTAIQPQAIRDQDQDPVRASSRSPSSTSERSVPELSAPDPSALAANGRSLAKKTPNPQSNQSNQASHKSSHPSGQPRLQWRQAGRAQRWTSLGSVDRTPLWALQLGTGAALIWIVCVLIQAGQVGLNAIFFFFSWIPFLRSIQAGGDPFWFVLVGLLALFVASPWLWDWILKRFYGLKPLTLSNLEQFSPESVRLLNRIRQQRRQPLPQLGILSLPAPAAFSYGYLPRHARIVVSQGILERLSDDEIAVIYASQLGHMADRSVGVLSWVALVAQLPYLIYWQVAAWGDRQLDRVLQSVAVLVSSLAYGLYWFCRLPGLWLSRVRLYYSDRFAVELTGNPNGLIRALLKTAIATAEMIQHQGYTAPLLESFDLLLPIGPRNTLTFGSVYPYHATSTLLEWDRNHRYRRWLTLNHSHPPLGDRIHRLSGYAQRWRLEPELDWPKTYSTSSKQGTASGATTSTQTPQSASPASIPHLHKLLLQHAPLVGIGIGVGVAGLLCLVGWLAYQARWVALDWLWLDWKSILVGCAGLGFGIGMIMQINPAFPDIRSSNLLVDPSLADLLAEPAMMPIDSQPVRFHGTLLGRQGFRNRFHQDLFLQTQTGLIRLHYTSRGGFLGNLLSQSRRPTDLMQLNAPVIVTGWFRRGVTPWVDVDTVQAQRGTTIRSGYPVWLTAIGCLAALWGAYVILRGV